MSVEFNGFLGRIFPGVSPKSASAVLELHKEGATVPFIARYRKEKTGNLDEVAVKAIIDGFELFNETVKRQAFILKEIESQGNLTTELKTRISGSWDLSELEEIYRPYKKKKKTKATVAREAGLEPLANWIWDLGHGDSDDKTTLEVKAKEFLNPAAKFVTYDLALKGAQDILIERISNSPELRSLVLKDIRERGKVVSRKTKEFKTHSKYEMYGEFEESILRLMDSKASHRYLAMRRGWQEGELAVTVEPMDAEYLNVEFYKFACSNPQSKAAEYLEQTARLSYAGHVLPSVVNEIHSQLKELADEHAITVFAENVRRLLLASPFGPKCTLGVDPGLRTGCKVALIDKSGHFLSHTVMHILGEGAEEKATRLFEELFKTVQVEAIAVGNGTGGRETDAFLRKVITKIGAKVPVAMVNESGASVYSASDVAREEFPDLDVTVRGAISIARRLQDPLAELVKIDPKSIGVGQYQHDVSQTRLKKSLDFVVESCVNNVGVDVNTASAYLLSYVSGIGPALAKSIVEYRKSTGLLTDRDSLQKIPRFSSKTYEQSAGFLRVMNGKNILDQTGIHPERYSAIREMASELGIPVSQLIGKGAEKLQETRNKWIALVGEFTFDDIVRELERPGRDPRDPFKIFSFRDDIFEVKDLKEAMVCPGLVTNVTNFGAFVDIGVHQDGLVHISELADKFVDDPRKVVNPGDQVTVKVLKVDLDRNQISLTMRMSTSAERSAMAAESQEARSRRNLENQQAARPSQNPRTPQSSRGPQVPRTQDGTTTPRTTSRGANPSQNSQSARPARSGESPHRRDSDSRGASAHRGAPPHQGATTHGDRRNEMRGEKHQRPERGGDRPRPGMDRKQPAFNNPFGALGAIKTQLKK